MFQALLHIFERYYREFLFNIKYKLRKLRKTWGEVSTRSSKSSLLSSIVTTHFSIFCFLSFAGIQEILRKCCEIVAEE